MPRKRVISIRFCAESKEDMELYARLKQEAGTSASLASVVKASNCGAINKLFLKPNTT